MEGLVIRKFLLIVASLLVVSAGVGAQHYNQSERVARANLTVSNDVMIGTTLLAAGEYRVACNRDRITFSRRDTNKDVLTVPCKGRSMPAVSDVTTLSVKTDASGKRVIDMLRIKGSAVEHIFP